MKDCVWEGNMWSYVHLLEMLLYNNNYCLGMNYNLCGVKDYVKN